MANVNTSGLDRFLSKLKKVQNLVKTDSDILKRIVQEVANIGEEYLRVLYSHISPEDVSMNPIPKVTTETNGNIGYIKANGYGVAYVEFGTGTIGQNSNYQGKLLQSGVPLTGSWKYNYDSKSKFISKASNMITWKVPRGIKGTTINQAGYTHGIKAGQQIFDTARYLEKVIPQIVERIVKEELS